MKEIDFLIKIRKLMVGMCVNGTLEAVLTERQWRDLVYKCLCSGATTDQIEELEKIGLSKDKIYEILNIGKDCGTCIKGENNDKRRKGEVSN